MQPKHLYRIGIPSMVVALIGLVWLSYAAPCPRTSEFGMWVLGLGVMGFVGFGMVVKGAVKETW